MKYALVDKKVLKLPDKIKYALTKGVLRKKAFILDMDDLDWLHGMVAGGCDEAGPLITIIALKGTVVLW